MSNASTRVVPLTGIMTEDSIQRPEFISCDLPNEEAERLVKVGSVVKVLKSEVPEGARVEISAPVAEAVPEPVPVPAAPIRIQLGAAGETAKAVKAEEVAPEPAPAPTAASAEAATGEAAKAGKAKP
ncbi:hypothetical protein VQH23_16240 [Pararoseomonas sp. SCSIO 73927]|uniref:hypothetical protein n=1 Tax=Pararoseomonas sp. SCSIO 73927 TaxID=3114537 RepID=UPI0030D47204